MLEALLTVILPISVLVLTTLVALLISMQPPVIMVVAYELASMWPREVSFFFTMLLLYQLSKTRSDHNLDPER